jgi:putative tryptophan/tyrosine transport system substrate-binding protein
VKRRTFITLHWQPRAQRLRKHYRIGVLSPELPPPGLLETFEEGLRELGYVQGENINFEVRNAGGDSQRLMELANELVRVHVVVILAVNTPAVQAAKKATQTIPIVMTRVADPIKLGIVPSLSNPSGNITGLNFMPDELSGKRLQILKEIFPSISRVAVLWYGANPGTTLVVRGMEAPSRELTIELLFLPVNGPDEFFKAFEIAKSGQAEALIVVDDALVTRHRVELLDLATKHHLPVVALFKPFAEAGALIAYGPSTPAMYRRAAYYVDRILRGIKPAELPVEQPTHFELVINLKTAKALGLEIPPTLLARADEVIE